MLAEIHLSENKICRVNIKFGSLTYCSDEYFLQHMCFYHNSDILYSKDISLLIICLVIIFVIKVVFLGFSELVDNKVLICIHLK